MESKRGRLGGVQEQGGVQERWQLMPTRFQRKRAYKLEKLLRKAMITATKKFTGKKKIY